jgi:hypothetical protein
MTNQPAQAHATVRDLGHCPTFRETQRGGKPISDLRYALRRSVGSPTEGGNEGPSAWHGAAVADGGKRCPLPGLSVIARKQDHPKDCRCAPPDGNVLRGWPRSTTVRVSSPSRSHVNQHSPTPMDIILYASADLGATWDLYSRQPTTQKQFVFRAARDGEYWFTSELVGVGLPSPNAVALAPQLRIIVDTQPPRLTLEVKSEPNAMVHVVWEAHDESLLPETVALQYQTNPGQSWKPLETQSTTSDPLRRTLRGETRFQPERGADVGRRASGSEGLG